jgi:hypothetical protein
MPAHVNALYFQVIYSFRATARHYSHGGVWIFRLRSRTSVFFLFLFFSSFFFFSFETGKSSPIRYGIGRDASPIVLQNLHQFIRAS